MVLLVFGLTRARLSYGLIVVPVVLVVLVAVFTYYRPFQRFFDWELLSKGSLGKVMAFEIIADNASDIPGGWLFGLGPGNSISRVALMGLPGYVNPASPVYMLGLTPAPATKEIWAMGYSSSVRASTSIWSGISSVLGLFGDLGLIGLFLYLWMCWKIFQVLRGRTTWEAGAAIGFLAMAGILGAAYDWLEEPGFMLYGAMMVGLALTGGKDKDCVV